MILGQADDVVIELVGDFMSRVDAINGVEEFAARAIEIVVVRMGGQDNVDRRYLILSERGTLGLGETEALRVWVVARWVKSRVSQDSQACDFDDGSRSANEGNLHGAFRVGHVLN